MRKAVFFKVILMLVPFFLQASHDYEKNDHVKISSNKSRGRYNIDYLFKDQWGNMQHFKLHYQATQTEQMSAKFGLPSSFFKPYLITPENVRERERLLKRGMFRNEGSTVMIDYDAVVSFYAPVFCKPIARLIRERLQQMGRDNRRNRIEMAMKFVQDIPYDVPDSHKNGRFRGGINTPPELLIEGYGDCDSKTLLFAGILCYLIDANDILFFDQDNHILTFVALNSNMGGTYLEWNGRRYYMAETAGPGRRALGESGSGDQHSGVPIPLNFQPSNNIDAPDWAEIVEDESYSNVSFNSQKNQLVFENNTRSGIWVMLHLKTNVGDWDTKAWYKLAPGQRAHLANTNHDVFYFYAEREDERGGVWEGDDLILPYEGNSFPMKKIALSVEEYKEYTEHIINLSEG